MKPLIETDLADELALECFPRELRLAGDLELTLTPLVPSDWKLLEEFLAATPEEERRFFRHDLSDPARVERWCSQLDYGHMLPLLAWHKGRIVADGMLQRETSFWTAHIGKLRLLVHPKFRRHGIATLLVDQLVEISQSLGLHKLMHECASDQIELIRFLSGMGFREASRLPEFIRDRAGTYHEMTLMLFDLETK